MGRGGLLTAVTLLTLPRLYQGLDMLVVSTCASGHFNTVSQVASAAVKRGHSVDVLTYSECEEKARNSIPGLRGYSYEPLMTWDGVDVKNWVGMFSRASELMYRNLTERAFRVVEKRLKAKKYDVVLAEFMSWGSTIAPVVSRVPVVTNHIGPLYPPYTESVAAGHRVSLIPAQKLKRYPKAVTYVIDYAISGAFYFGMTRNLISFIEQVSREYDFDSSALQPDAHVAQAFSYMYSITIVHGLPHLDLCNVSRYEDDDNVYWIGYSPEPIATPDLRPGNELHHFIQSSRRPVVFMSMGTMLIMPEDEQSALLQGLERQDHFTFVWAVQPRHLQFLRSQQTDHSRVFIGSRLPQLEILLNNQVKIFITHGGANSIMESIYAKKPMLLFPEIGDQGVNSQRISELGAGFLLESFTAESILSSLQDCSEPVTYSKVLAKLEELGRFQTSLGGFEKGVDILEQVANGTIKVKDVKENLGTFLPHLKRVWLAIAGGMLMSVGLVMYLCFRLCCCIFRCRSSKREKTE